MDRQIVLMGAIAVALLVIAYMYREMQKNKLELETLQSKYKPLVASLKPEVPVPVKPEVPVPVEPAVPEKESE